jgi:hypothetical protein
MNEDEQKQWEEEERRQEEEERQRRADIREVTALIRSKVTEDSGWAIAWALTRIADEIADAATFIGNRIEGGGGDPD